MRKTCLILVSLISLCGLRGTSYGQFFGLGRSADETPPVTQDALPNPACGMQACPPRATTYGYYYVSWRRWPEDETKYSTAPTKLSPFVIPDRSLPDADIPDAVDETSVAPRKRPQKLDSAQPADQVAPRQDATAKPSVEENAAEPNTSDSSNEPPKDLLPEIQEDKPSPTTVPDTQSDDLFNDLEAPKGDSEIPPSKDDEFNLDDLQGSRLQRRRDYTYARRSARATKRRAEESVLDEFVAEMGSELREPQQVANEVKPVSAETKPLITEPKSLAAEFETPWINNPLRRARAESRPAPVRHAVYEAKSSDDNSKETIKASSDLADRSIKLTNNPLRARAASTSKASGSE